jgi:ribosomal protein S18 acetylase RimI-like enzyme
VKLLWELLSNGLERGDFDCGLAQLNDYFHKFAGQNHRSRLAVCSVALTEDRQTVVGFYTLSASEIARASFPPGIIKGLPRYPVPVIKIGQIAVDKRFQSQGTGKAVLAHALRTVLRNPTYGAVAVVVDSLTDHATEFYRRHGFVSIDGTKASPMVISLGTVAKAFGGVSC